MSQSVSVAIVHEVFLFVLIVIVMLQFLVYRFRLRVRQNQIVQRDEEIEQLRQDYQAMQQEANYDTLTGLPNRRNFERNLPHLLDQITAGSQDCSVLMIDFDHFKAINDSFGHQAGDLVLKSLADQLRELVNQEQQSPRSLCARYGGDEFAVILPACGSQAAQEFAERLRERIESQQMELPGQCSPLTISIGYATYPRHLSAPGKLLELADQSLYQAKRSGRNQVRRPAEEDDILKESEPPS